VLIWLRFSPELHTKEGLSAEKALQAVITGSANGFSA